MAKGVAYPPEHRERAIQYAIGALADGCPVNVIAAGCSVNARTLSRWLQFNRAAYAARVDAIVHWRIARELTPKQKAFWQATRLSRLSLSNVN